jgi:pyruvate/2-oxoglutarate dehydrogenase complex dihydrolipoamide dehydrogenase (E3) component
VLVATGARPRVDGWYQPAPHLHALPGFDLPHVVTTWDALGGAVDGATHVVVIDAHGYHHTTDVVERFAALGVRTTVITTAPVFAPEVDDHDRPAVMAAVRDAPVELLTSTIVEAIEPGAVRSSGTFRGEARVIGDVDAVVLSTGQAPIDALFHELDGVVPAVQRIGDCLAPRGVEHAIFEGHRAARALA